MDWDDDRLKPKRSASIITAGEPLGNLSIAELEARIATLIIDDRDGSIPVIVGKDAESPLVARRVSYGTAGFGSLRP